jgi:hypothetical protein
MEDAGGEEGGGDKNSCKIGSLKVKKSGRKKCGNIQRRKGSKIGKLSTLTRKQYVFKGDEKLNSDKDAVQFSL